MSHFESVTSVGPGFEETGCTPFGASGEPHRFAASGSNAPHRWGIYHDIWQCPTALVPIEVDGRGSAFVIVRPIHSERAMTATPAELPEALVAELRQQVLALGGVSGLALDVTTKPPGTIEWE